MIPLSVQIGRSGTETKSGTGNPISRTLSRARVDRNEGRITRSPCDGAAWTGSRSRRLVALIAIRSLGAAPRLADSLIRRLGERWRTPYRRPAHVSSRACAHEATGLARDEAGFGDVPAATASGCLASDAPASSLCAYTVPLLFALFSPPHSLSDAGSQIWSRPKHACRQAGLCGYDGDAWPALNDDPVGSRAICLPPDRASRASCALTLCTHTHQWYVWPYRRPAPTPRTPRTPRTERPTGSATNDGRPLGSRGAATMTTTSAQPRPSR